MAASKIITNYIFLINEVLLKQITLILLFNKKLLNQKFT